MSYLGSPPNKLTTTTVITNDLTVDTNTLYVDSTNNRIGLGTAAPVSKVDVVHTSDTRMLISEEATNTSTLATVNTANTAYSDLNIYSNNLKLSTSGAERVRINSSGNVGIGTSTPSNKVDVVGTVRFTNTANSANFGTIGDGGGLIVASGNNNPMYFYTGGSERMRIDASGNVLVGTTSQIEGSRVCISATNGLGINVTGAGGGALNANYVSTGTGYFGYFKYGGTVVGSITSTGSSTAYNTSSDYRLKENVVTITDGIERVKQLNPSRFNFISNADTTVDGFIAHEVQSIVPEAITGEKDAVDEDGNPEYQGIDQAKLVPLLTAALQEAITKLETLEARVAALENV